MKSDHCLVKLGDMTIPLIGIPVDAGLEECDLCHERFALWEVEWTGRQILCEKCRGKGKKK